MAESAELSELRDRAVAHVRRESRFSHTFIPLAAIFAFFVAISLYAPGLYADRITGGFTAIGAMVVPILVVVRAQQVQQEGRILALAYYIREYMDDTGAGGEGNTSGTA